MPNGFPFAAMTTGEIFLSGVLAALIAVAMMFWRRSRLALPVVQPPNRQFEWTPPGALHGLRIALSIEQDAKNPVFRTLLEEQFAKFDPIWAEEAEADVLIRGQIKCNGYTDVYFEGEIEASYQGEPLVALFLRPYHGDRQRNLAIDVSNRVEDALGKKLARDERQSALRELGGS